MKKQPLTIISLIQTKSSITLLIIPKKRNLYFSDIHRRIIRLRLLSIYNKELNQKQNHGPCMDNIETYKVPIHCISKLSEISDIIVEAVDLSGFDKGQVVMT